MDSTLHDGAKHPLGQPALEKRIMHHSNFHHILLVGEGDFSFSAALARAFGSAENIVATSLDSREQVISSYNFGQNNLRSLEKRGAMTLHSVDAKIMKKHEILRGMLFDRIVYNFPHAGFFAKESDDKLIKKHRHLLKMFFQNGVNMLNKNGEIHVTHKEGDPYDKWNLVEQAQKCGLILKESVDFNKADYPGYVNRRGAEPNIGDTFFLGKCKTYMFIPRESMATPSKPTEFSSQGHPEGLGAALLMELETERQNRKAAETAKMELESSLNQLRTVSTKTLIENDELRRQRDEAFQEKTNITRQLAEALRLKEDAEKQKDVTILELAIERKAREDAESAKANVEGSLNYNKASVYEQLKKMNQLERQRDDALYRKAAVVREKEQIARQLAEALRLKEAAIDEKDRVLRERKDLTNQKDEIISWTIVVFCGLGIFKLVSSMYSRKK